MTDQEQGDLSKAMGAVLEQLLARGFVLPLRFAAIASNGSALIGCYVLNERAGGLACEMLAEHIESDGFALPVNLMFVDERQEAARVVLTPDGMQLH